MSEGHRRKVSIVTVCLNHKVGLERTLASVRVQSWTNLEHIVVDGGSTDGSVELLQKHLTTKTFKYVSEPDKGIYDAMNKGWRLTDGHLVVFMNAGDAFASENVIEAFAKTYDGDTWRWGYGCMRTFDTNGQLRTISSFVPFRLDRLALGLSTVPHQATVMERQLLVELGGFLTDVGVAADQELLLRAALVSPPQLWGEFFADFEGGGVGSTRASSAFVRDMGRFRDNLGLRVAGGRLGDRLATLALTIFKVCEANQTKLRRRNRWHGAELIRGR
jgi:glycosyltransferase involved in cell wall biosynthesis